MSRPHILFITGKLAEKALQRTLEKLSSTAEFSFAIQVLPISVIALATTDWIARHLPKSGEAERYDRVILPGMCRGELQAVQDLFRCQVLRGPDDFRDLPDFFGKRSTADDYGQHDIQILAEINHAPRLTLAEIRTLARSYQEAGADLIDVGCEPGPTWAGVRDVVRMLREEGHRVSIDTFNLAEVEEAVQGGAELVLSVNSTNVDQARNWGVEVVLLPDDLTTMAGLEENLEKLTQWRVPFRVDPIVEPIGLGFAASLGRYLEVRRRFPEIEMMMGIGNLTELTDVDSSGVNVLLLGFCQELSIRSVLTTQVINWCRSSVKEVDIGRRLVYHSIKERIPPKKLTAELLMLRDARLRSLGPENLNTLKQQIRDRNYRIFAEEGIIHILNSQVHLSGTDAFDLLEKIEEQDELTASHAFYLGYEMAKASIALTLGKNYTQDQALQWGFLTVKENSHREKSRSE